MRTSSTRVFASHSPDDRNQPRLTRRIRAALADSASSLYTTSFPIHSTPRSLRQFQSAAPEQCLKRGAWVGRFRSFAVGGCNPFFMEHYRLRQRHQSWPSALSRKSQPHSRQQHLRRLSAPRFAFTRIGANSHRHNLNVPITYSSSDTAILNIAPNGVACAGHWDVAFTTCTPGGTGVALGDRLRSRCNPAFLPTYSCIRRSTTSPSLEFCSMASRFRSPVSLKVSP